MGSGVHVRGQLLGYKTLPEQSGLWGLLLPKPGDKAVAHEPDAQDVVRRLDESCLVFENSMQIGNRGFGLSLGAYTAALVGVTLLPLIVFLAPKALIPLSAWEWLLFGALLRQR